MADSTLASVPEDSATTASTSGLPAAAKAAAEQAVKAAIAETAAVEEGEIAEDSGKDSNGSSSNGIKTVFSDPANFNVVHPLYSKWILWFDNASKQNKAKDWNEQLQEVMAFETVEEFWGLYNKFGRYSCSTTCQIADFAWCFLHCVHYVVSSLLLTLQQTPTITSSKTASSQHGKTLQTAMEESGLSSYLETRTAKLSTSSGYTQYVILI